MFSLKKLLYVCIVCLTLSLVIYIPYSFFKESEISSQSHHKPVKPKKVTHQVSFAAFGDLMMHSPQIKDGKQANDSYDFKHVFKKVKPYLSQVDLAVGNFETTLAGPSKPYSGYPIFNAPDQIADALKDAGVDLMSTANNHAADTGVLGIKRTYQQLSKKGITPFGTATKKEEQKPVIVEKNNIKIAFLAYTEHTNGNLIPKNKKYMVNLIQSKKIAKDIKKAKAEGAEFVIVSMHFGIEYQRQPSKMQKKVAHQALKDGADVILGSHPHVLQPMEKVKIDGKEKFIIYSMGNFVSNQSDPHTDEGIIVYFNIQKNPSKKVRLTNVSYLPTFVHKFHKSGKKSYVIIPTPEQQPKTLTYPRYKKSQWRKNWMHTTQLMENMGSFPTFSPQP